MLRWKAFVPAEDDAFVKMLDASTKATGVGVTVTREQIEEIQPKAAVAANTGAGPDLIWAAATTPHLFPQKCPNVTDVADYLDKKYGGWVPSAVAYGKGTGSRWIDIPVCYTGYSINYRVSSLKEAGFSTFPTTTSDFLEYAKATKRNKAWRSRTRPCRGRRNLLGPLVPMGPRRQHSRQERQGNPELAENRDGLGIRQATLFHYDPRGRFMDRHFQQQGIPYQSDILDRQYHFDLCRRQQ
jgi:Bacterial extracellular solute-binding protein